MVARRAERSGWRCYEADPDAHQRRGALYLNRLSDLLFILGRVANPAATSSGSRAGRGEIFSAVSGF